MSDRTKLVILVAASLGLAWSLWYVLAGEDGLPGPARRGEGPARQARFTAQEVPEVLHVRPEAVAGEAFDRGRNDIFKYEESPEERARREEEARRRREEEERRRREEAIRRAEEARRRAEEEARRRAAEAARLAKLRAQESEPEPEPEPVEPAKPDPPTFPHQFAGFIGPKEDAIAILRDTKEEDFRYARTGQVVEDQFKVERVGQLKLVLSFTDPLFEGELRQVPLQVPEGGAAPVPTTPDSRPSRRTRRR